MVEGNVVRPNRANDRPGGTEQLDWSAWDVQTHGPDRRVAYRRPRPAAGAMSTRSSRAIGDRATYRLGGRLSRARVTFTCPSGKTPRCDGYASFPTGGLSASSTSNSPAASPNSRCSSTSSRFMGKTLVLETQLPAESKALEQIKIAADIPDAGRLYHEARRPQFHFTSRRGWLNDPNGMLWFDGEYHLFYQHNPYGWDWGNMHWGHAVSRDLVHWTELPIALYPKQYGDWCFSGSGVVDRRNTSGFGRRHAPPLVAAFTSTGRGECIIFSNDRGRTWSEYRRQSGGSSRRTRSSLALA